MAHGLIGLSFLGFGFFFHFLPNLRSLNLSFFRQHCLEQNLNLGNTMRESQTMHFPSMGGGGAGLTFILLTPKHLREQNLVFDDGCLEVNSCWHGWHNLGGFGFFLEEVCDLLACIFNESSIDFNISQTILL